MYDQLFSPQWIFDRGLELEVFFFPLIFITAALVIAPFYQFLKKSKLLLALCYLLAFILVFIGLISLYLAICNDKVLWESVDPARQLNNQLKWECANNRCPTSLKQLSQLNPNLYHQITSHAKTAYYYSLSTHAYTWYVQPSLYYVEVLKSDSAGLFKLPSLLPVKHWGNVTPILEKPDFPLPQ